jgi:peptidoglycan/LPS O-acetylase OafA/YrhL
MVFALEGLRGIAALMVALYHGWDSAITGPLHGGWLSVDLFFVISGFVMVHVYRDQLATGTQVASFALRRFGRLYPLHLVTLFAFIGCEMVLQLAKPVATIFGKGTNPANFDLVEGWSLVSNLLLLNGFTQAGGRAYNVPSWSISTEIWTYALFAATVFLLHGRKRILAWALLAIFALACWLLIPPTKVGQGADNLCRCVYGFFLGAMLPMLRAKMNPSARELVLLQALGAVATVLAFYAADRWAQVKFAAPVGFALLVLSVSFGRGPLDAFLRLRPLQRLGLLSYSVYMVHYPLLVLVNPVGMALPDPYSSLLRVGYVALLLVLSEFTYRWIEDPWRHRFQGYAQRLGAHPAAARA